MSWTKKKLDKESEILKPQSENEIIVKGVKKGRPGKKKTVKTNLDLSVEIVLELDNIAEYLGSTRQSVVKGFILNGLQDFYRSREAKKKMKKKN